MQLHASAIAFSAEGERGDDAWIGLLIMGRSGAGKSELALELIGHGARLVADDQTEVTRAGDRIWLSAPAAIRGMIELRGLGVLRATPLNCASLAAIVDLDVTETERLPKPRRMDVLNLSFPVLGKAPGRAFAIGLKHYLLARQWCDADGLNANVPERS